MYDDRYVHKKLAKETNVNYLNFFRVVNFIREEKPLFLENNFCCESNIFSSQRDRIASMHSH